MPFTLINYELVKDVAAAAQNSVRRRSLYTFHVSNEERVHRMLSVLEPDSYVRPHRHAVPDKTEVFIILTGKLLVVEFADDGRIADHIVLEAGRSPWGVEMPPGTWHMTLALAPSTAMYEVVDGPWRPSTHKRYPDWAPPEEDGVAGQAFIARVRQELMLY